MMENNYQGEIKEFLLSEYSNIAQAHFKSIENITTFFRYYILIMSVPIPAIAIIFQITQDKQRIIDIVQQYKWLISIPLICISIIGSFVCCYIINLRLDAILYARVVNGIRKFFYDRWNEDLNLKLRIRCLPQSPQLPNYFEESFFLPVVAVFGIMNTLYLYFAIYIISQSYFYSTGLSIIFLLLHPLIYWLYAYHRDISYLKSNIIGIDIDGVLNKHREKFCYMLYEKTEKKIDPEEIAIIPVHEHPTMGISKEDENKVFNDPAYWADMDDNEDAAEIIRKLRNVFKLKIYVFTHRPWPAAETKKELLDYKKEFINKWYASLSLKNKLLRCTIKPSINPLKQITKQWLKKHNFLYDKFIFEKGNEYSSDPRGEFNNRFYVARKKKIRFFVEDDIEKAMKLSYICDVVFLISHPYNEPNKGLPSDINEFRKTIPSNIIRVKNWNEIYKQIRRLS